CWSGARAFRSPGVFLTMDSARDTDNRAAEHCDGFFSDWAGNASSLSDIDVDLPGCRSAWGLSALPRQRRVCARALSFAHGCKTDLESFTRCERSEERRVGKECRCRWWAYD